MNEMKKKPCCLSEGKERKMKKGNGLSRPVWMDVLVYLSKEPTPDIPLAFAVWDFQIPILQELTDRGLLPKNWPGIYYRIKDFCHGIPADMT